MPKHQFDVIVVGAGAAGITVAISLAKSGARVIAVESAPFPGAENWSGCVYFTENLAADDVLGRDGVESLPYERKLSTRGAFMLRGGELAGLSYTDRAAFADCYTVLRPVYDHALAHKAEQLGVTVMSATTVEGLIRSRGRVIGVSTDRGPLYAPVVFLAEGDASHLVTKEGLETVAAPAKPHFLQGIKEVLALDSNEIEKRFHLKPGEGAAFEIIIRNGHVGGKVAPLNMGGFLYTNRDSLSVGLVLPLDTLSTHFSGDHTRLMAWFKSRSGLAPWLAGTTSVAYGAKLIRGGGAKELPRMVEDGLAVGGAACGAGIDFPYPNYTGPATATGRLFADAYRAIRAAGGDFSKADLERHYAKPVKDTRYFRDVQFLRDWPGYVEKTRVFFENQVDFGMGTARAWGRPDVGFATAVRDQALALGMAFPPNRMDKWKPDLTALDNVFSMTGRVKRALSKRFARGDKDEAAAGRGAAGGSSASVGEVRFIYRPSGRPATERSLNGSALGAALGSAARAVYSDQDDRPLADRLDTAIDSVVGRMPLRVMLKTLIAGAASAAVLPIMSLWNRLRGKKPSDADPAFVDWVKAGLLAGDLNSTGPSQDERWEQKLGRLTYFAEPVSHIQVPWPDSISQADKTPYSPLWHVCPAHVYEKRTDLTGRPTLVVNYENCIKCESCWRATEAVDWSRNRRQRLIYQLPIETAAELAAEMDRLDGGVRPVLPYTVDPWEGAQAAGSQPAGIGGAIERLRAKLKELADTVAATGRFVDTGRRHWVAELVDHAEPALAEITAAVAGLPADAPARILAEDLKAKLAEVRGHIKANKNFWAAADCKQILEHHLVGLSRLAGGESRSRLSETVETAQPASSPHIPTLALDRRRVLELDSGRAPTASDWTALSALYGVPDAAEAAAGVRSLAGGDPGLAYIVLSHRAARAALEAGGVAPGRRRLATALAEPLKARREGASWRLDGHIPLVAAGWADQFLVRADEGLFLVERRSPGLEESPVRPLGLRSAEPVSLALTDVTPMHAIVGPAAEKAWAAFHRTLAPLSAALSLGAGEYLIRRAKEHATGRVQFPGLFTDEAGRESILKFGAVKAMLSQMEARRWALDTLLQSAPPSDAAVARWVRLAAADFMGPRPGGFGYDCGQIFGGTAFSEEDTLAKFYRDSQTLHFLPMSERDFAQVGVSASTGSSACRPEPADDPDWYVRSKSIPSLAKTAGEWWQTRARLCECAGDAQSQFALSASTIIPVARGGVAPSALPPEALDRANAMLYVWSAVCSRTSKRVTAGIPSEHEVELTQLLGEYCRQQVEAALGGAAGKPADAPRLPIPAFAPKAAVGYDPVLNWEGKYDSGDYLLKPDFSRPRHFPELLVHDARLGAFHAKLEKFFTAHYKVPEYGRQIEKLHRVPPDDIERLQREGLFRLIVPAEFGGVGSLKAEYYAMISASIRRGDMAQALTIQVNSSIGTTPILLGLEEDLPRGRKEIDAFLADAEGRAKLTAAMRDLRKSLGDPGKDLVDKTKKLASEIIGLLSKSAAVRSVAADFQSAFEKALNAGKAFDLAGAARHMDAAIPAWEALESKVRALKDELPRRKAAMELFLRLIAAGQVSGFALTEPSAGSDTARVATRAKLTGREVFTDADGVKHFFLDDAKGDRRNLLDADRLVFENGAEPGTRRILYRHRDGEAPVEIRTDAYDYETDKGKRYIEVAGKRVEFDDIAQIRRRDGREFYDYWEMSGNKMWITNGRMAGVFCLYARTPAGPTGFLVDRHAEGLVVGKDEEKLGQLGSPTNELSLDRVRVPAENIIGLEGRGQVNALQTLNVGRVGLALSSAAMLERLSGEVRDFAHTRSPRVATRGLDAYVEARLDEIDRLRYVVESVAYEMVGLLEQVGGNKLIIESSLAKFFAAETVHDVLAIAQEVYGAAGQTTGEEIEKHFRDARVLNIYEGTNEVQRFAILKELVDKVAAGAKDVRAAEAPADWPAELRSAFAKLEAERLGFWRDLGEGIVRLGKQVWMNPNLQSTFFPLAEAAGRLKAADSALFRAAWLTANSAEPAAADRARRHAAIFTEEAVARIGRLRAMFRDRWAKVAAEVYPPDIRVAVRMTTEEGVKGEGYGAGGVAEPVVPDRIERPLQILVPVRIEPLPAPEPQIVNGRLAAAHVELTAADRAALVRARRIKKAAPQRVRVTVMASGPGRVRAGLREALAIGADEAVWIPEADYPDQAALWAREMAEAWAVHGFGPRETPGAESRWSREAEPASYVSHPPDLILCAAGEAGWPAPALLAAAFDGREVDGLGGFRVEADAAGVRLAGRLGAEPVDLTESAALPLVAGLSSAADERAYSAADRLEAQGKPIRVVDLPAGVRPAETRLETGGHSGVKSAALPAELTPQTAVAVLAEEAGLNVGAAAATTWSGALTEGLPADFGESVLYLVGTADDEPAPESAAGFAVAACAAEWAGRPAAAMVLCGTDEAVQRRWAAAMAAAGAKSIVVVPHEQLQGLPAPAVMQVLSGLPLGTAPMLVAAPAVAQAAAAWSMRSRAGALVGAAAGGVSGNGNGNGHDGNGTGNGAASGARPVVLTGLQSAETAGGALRTTMAAGAMRREYRLAAPPVGGLVLGLASGVSMPRAAPAAAPSVRVHRPAITYDRATDPVASALAAALRSAGADRLEEAEFILDVGYGIGNVDNFEELIPPLKKLLEECGVRRVTVGGTRRVTEELKILPTDRQIGQSGVSVNPTIMLCIGVSGAPQHLNYIGDRAVILAFNRDAEAPLLTLNQRRPRPKVHPVVGDLFVTVPALMEALRQRK